MAADGVSPPSPRGVGGRAPPPLELPPPSGQDLSLYTGGTCLVVFSFYVLVHTVPHWGDWVTASIARQHGVTAVIGGQYAALTAASYAHAVAHYDLIATVGAGTFWRPSLDSREEGGWSRAMAERGGWESGGEAGVGGTRNTSRSNGWVATAGGRIGWGLYMPVGTVGCWRGAGICRACGV